MHWCAVRYCVAAMVAVTFFATPACGREAWALETPSPQGYTDAAVDSVQQGQATDKAAIKEEMARIGRGEVAGTRQWERRKSPTVALLSSMMLPGLGQLYNGRKYKTMIAVGVFTFYLGTAWFEQKESQERLVERDTLPPNSIAWQNQDILYRFHKENAVTYLWWAGAAWLITALDAYIDAHLYDVRAVTPEVVRGAGDTKYVALSFSF